MAGEVPSEMLEVWREAFFLFDKNGDGTIDGTELQNVMRAMGANPTAQDCEELIAEVDTNANGSIEFDEFVELMSTSESGEVMEANGPEELQKAFRVFDVNGDGKISAAELELVLTRLGESLTSEEVAFMLEFADTDGDGSIDLSEFANLLTRS